MKINLQPELAGRLQGLCGYLQMRGRENDAAAVLLEEMIEALEKQPELLGSLVEQITYETEKGARAAALAALWAVTRGGRDFEGCVPQHIEVEWAGGSARLDALDIAWENVTPPAGAERWMSESA